MPKSLLLIALALCVRALAAANFRADLPQRFTDQEFWQLSTDLSEPGGSFASDNLVSNEREISTLAAALRTKVAPGAAYLGVGPEQNFTYIATVRPRMAFIVDIRRDNLRLHLLYKALFELSADRAEFVSRLFIKKRPDGVGSHATAAQLVNAFWPIFTGDEAAFRANLSDVLNTLTVRHGFALSEEDRTGIERIYHAFYWNGPRITWVAKVSPPDPGQQVIGLPTWGDLMMLPDDSGGERSFLATEEQYLFVKQLEERNLVVPVVGDFAGPKALRGVGNYVRARGSIVRVLYASNVESVLQNLGKQTAFCANAATLPQSDDSVIVRWGRMLPGTGPYDRGQAVISYRPGGVRTIVINGQTLPPDQVDAYFAQPPAAVIGLRDEVRRCAGTEVTGEGPEVTERREGGAALGYGSMVIIWSRSRSRLMTRPSRSCGVRQNACGCRKAASFGRPSPTLQRERTG